MSEEDKMATDWGWCYENPHEAAYQIDCLNRLMQKIAYLCDEHSSNNKDGFITVNAIKEVVEVWHKLQKLSRRCKCESL